MPRKQTPPPVKCRGTSKRTGGPCGHWASPGDPNMLCWHHGSQGGATKDASRAKREANETFARLLESAPRRDPWEIVADATHVADVALRDEWRRTVEAEDLTTEQVTRLLEATRYAHSMAGSVITLRAQEIKVRIEHAKAEMIGRALNRVRDDPAVGLSMDRKSAFDAAIAREFRALADAEKTIDPPALTSRPKRGSR